MFLIILLQQSHIWCMCVDNPKPPYPYIVKDTVFYALDGAVLSGTITMPKDTKGKKEPAIVMVTGSGQQNRDEELFEHKPFAR